MRLLNSLELAAKAGFGSALKECGLSPSEVDDGCHRWAEDQIRELTEYLESERENNLAKLPESIRAHVNEGCNIIMVSLLKALKGKS